MHTGQELPICSKCGSVRSETFHQHGYGAVERSGRRCRDCKHESVIRETLPNDESISYVRTTTDNVF